jgi:hypothetical protein
MRWFLVTALDLSHFIKSEQGTEEKDVGDIKGHQRTQNHLEEDKMHYHE